MKLFLNDSNHLNLTDIIRGNRVVQKSDDNSAYYNKYCNKNKIKNKKRRRGWRNDKFSKIKIYSINEFFNGLRK